MRGFACLEAYARDHEVDLIVLPLAGGGPIPPETTQLCRHAERIAPWRYGAHLARLRRGSLPSLCRYLPGLATHQILHRQRGTPPAILHVQRLALAPLGLRVMQALQPGAALLDLDEDDAGTFTSLAGLLRLRGELPAAAKALRDAEAFANLQRQALPGFDHVLVCAPEEANKLAFAHPGARIDLIPNAPPALRPLAATSAATARDIDLLLVGNFNYLPNRDGAEWLLQQVLPLLPHGLRVVMAGNCPPALARLLASDTRITVCGPVPDLAPLYARARLALAPLRAGGGTRIKILEAVMQGVPVVSTSIGAAGLPFRSGSHLWLADDAADFAACCLAALNDPNMAAQRAEAARAMLECSAPRETTLAAIAALAVTAGAAAGHQNLKR